ncbi:hypothetical protein BSN81_11150 [Acinetobacter baylyi]|nr:hypothetical protein BSN81_11150 [Acinetobacter baylyi]MAK32354.1 hypothetical protein [Acinetobacter sp.]
MTINKFNFNSFYQSNIIILSKLKIKKKESPMNTLPQANHQKHSQHGSSMILQMIIGWTIVYAGAIIITAKAFHSLI